MADDSGSSLNGYDSKALMHLKPCNIDISCFSENQIAQIEEKLEQWLVGPRQVAIWLGISYDAALQLLWYLESQGKCEIRLLTYHCEEAPVYCSFFSEGHPALPWECPECQQDVDSVDKFGFDIMASKKSNA